MCYVNIFASVSSTNLGLDDIPRLSDESRSIVFRQAWQVGVVVREAHLLLHGAFQTRVQLLLVHSQHDRRRDFRSQDEEQEKSVLKTTGQFHNTLIKQVLVNNNR